MLQPDYVCAIIRDPGGRYLLEQRPANSRHAAGQWTCFGGWRESGEPARACLMRELHEELGWHEAPVSAPRIALWVRGRLVAWFCEATFRQPDRTILQEPGRGRQWVSAIDDLMLPISPWHRAVLVAARSRCAAVHLP